MTLHASYQRLVERLFFGGRSTRVSEAVSFIAANLFLYVVVFFFLLNTVVYDWTGEPVHARLSPEHGAGQPGPVRPRVGDLLPVSLLSALRR